MEGNDQLTEGKRKTVRVHIAIIDHFTNILRDLLNSKIAATDLYKNHVRGKYKTSPKGRKLESWEDILQKEGHLDLVENATDYAEFDITLLYKSLRNFCTWAANEKPTSGWGVKEMPVIGEETVGDDIERIRLLRNKFYGHISSFEISDQEYDDCWKIITDVCERMEKRTVGTSYCQDIKKLEKQRMNLDSFQDMIKYIDKNTHDIVEKVRDVERVIRDEGQVARDDHHEVITSLQRIERRIMLNPQAEAEKSRTVSNNVLFVAATVCVVMIAVFIPIFVQDGDKGKHDNSSLFLIMGILAFALVIIISVIFVRPVSKLGFQRKRNRNNRGILSDSNLADLARKLGKENELFLYNLKLSTPEIEQIQLDNPNQVVVQTVKGLALWRDKEQYKDFEELVKDLLTALTNADRNDLVEEITEKHKLKVILPDCRREKNNLTIVCDISPSPDLSFSVTWEKDGRKIDIDGRTEKYRGGTQSQPSLKILNFEDDCGSYQCIVTSVMGTFRSNILKMNHPVVNASRPVCSHIAPVNIVIPCNVLDNGPLSVSNVLWTKNDVEIGNQTKYMGGNINEPSLTILNASNMDRGIYTCLAENVVGVGKSTVKLDIPEVRITGPSSVNFEERATFFATYSSDIEVTSYKWQKIAENSIFTTLDIDEEKYTGSSIDRLVINDAVLSDGAEYRLLVENVLGEGKSNGIQLIVKEDIFGKKELWKNNDECVSVTGETRFNLYRKLFWDTKEKKFSCTVEELLEHLNQPNKYGCLESLEDENTVFDSENSEKITLWDFFHENGDVSRNIKFWFEKSSDNSIIERYCVSSQYSRHEKETVICLPSEFVPEFVRKLDVNILKHKTMRDESIRPYVSDILKIPIEILHFGDDGIQNYLKQLSKGKVKVYHARGMIVGCGGAGKTTLLKKLKELPLDNIRNTKSTRGVDIQADVFTVSGDKISVTAEKVLTHFNIKQSTTAMIEVFSDKQAPVVFYPDEQPKSSNESSARNALGNSKNKSTDDNNDQSFVDNEFDNGFENKVTDENTSTKSDVLSEIEMRSSDESLENVLDIQEKQMLEPIQLLSFLSAIKEDTPQTITIYDFAGQFAYYVSHQLYLSPRAFYLLVIDMTKNLDDFVIEEKVYIGWTYRGVILHWMKMIHAMHGLARVILVATHAEGKSREEIKEFFVQIWDLIPEDIQKCHLDCKDEFAVELEESSGIVEIKESILKIVSTANHWGEIRPTSWVMFENYLMKAKMKIKVMKMEDLWTENKKLDIKYQIEKKEDITNMLLFFHDTGTVLYFDEEDLRDDIILDVPWFVDGFKHIITDPVHANEDFVRIQDTFVSEHLNCKTALDGLKQSGILTVGLIRAIWKLYKDTYDTYNLHMHEIMRYMERLGMIAKITNTPEVMWYVPCMNKNPFPKEDFGDYTVSPTVCFQFKFLPPAIYHRLIATCLNQLGFKIPKWPKPEYCYKNAGLLHKTSFEYKYYVLIGHNELENRIEMQILSVKGCEFDKQNSTMLKKEITNHLSRLTKTFHTNIGSFTVGYRCRNSIFGEKPAAHFIPESHFAETTIICQDCKQLNRIVAEDVLSHWNQKTTEKGEIIEDVAEQRIDEQARKANDNSNRVVGGNVSSQGVTFILETNLRVPGVGGCWHISCVSSESAWVSDIDGSLRQVDKHGSVIKTVSGRQTLDTGSHTVTRDGDLLFIDSNQRHVYRVAGEEQILTLQTDQCKLSCIFSPRNGDLLIGGEYRDDRGKQRGVVLRYNAKGDTCIQEIERDEAGRHLYTGPRYITENMNGDVIVSDLYNKLVVVDKSGRHRFAYTGPPSGSQFTPCGVCTDTSGRILVCDLGSHSVHILTRDGEFLSLLQTEDHGIERPCSICMDNEQRVWVGDAISNTVCIYRYPAPQ